MAIWLLGVFMINITPREFVHLFADHEDTHDTVVKGLAFSAEHKHCSFLNIGVPPYEIVGFSYCPVIVSVAWDNSIVPLVQYHYSLPSIAFLRGPPSTVLS